MRATCSTRPIWAPAAARVGPAARAASRRAVAPAATSGTPVTPGAVAAVPAAAASKSSHPPHSCPEAGAHTGQCEGEAARALKGPAPLLFLVFVVTGRRGRWPSAGG